MRNYFEWVYIIYYLKWNLGYGLDSMAGQKPLWALSYSRGPTSQFQHTDDGAVVPHWQTARIMKKTRLSLRQKINNTWKLLVYAAIYVDQPKLIPVSDCLANSEQNESFKIGNTMSITHGRKRPHLSTTHVNSEIIIQNKIMYSRNHDTNIQVINFFSLLIIVEWAQVIYKNSSVIWLNHFDMIAIKISYKANMQLLSYDVYGNNTTNNLKWLFER